MKKRILTLLFIISLVLVGLSSYVSRAAASNSITKSLEEATLSLKTVGHFGGEMVTISIAGEEAFVNQGPDLLVVDITQPTAPQEQGKVTLPEEIADIAIDGTYAYVADREGGLIIVDVSDPSHPKQVGSIGIDALAPTRHMKSNGSGKHPSAYPGEIKALAVAVSGDYAYVAIYHEGMAVVDISDPTQPRRVGIIEEGSYINSGNLAVAGDYVYVIAGEELLVTDVHDPTNPQQVASLDIGDTLFGITVEGEYVFTIGDSGLTIVDISDPTNPHIVGSAEIDVGVYPDDVVVSNGYAYIANFGNGLVVVDVSDPANPQKVGSLGTSGAVMGVAISGNTVYMANLYNLSIADVSDPSHPTLLENTLESLDPNGIAVNGTYAYVVDYRRFVAVDVEDPTQPHIIGSLNVRGDDIAIDGDNAYIVNPTDGLLVIDVSDPQHPQQIGNLSTTMIFNGLTVSGDYAYIAAGDDGLVVVDVSDPTHPSQVGALSTSTTVEDVAVAGGYAYLAESDGYTNSMAIVDISDPTHPQQVGNVEFSDGYPEHLVVSGQYAYVAAYPYLMIVDVSDPEHPQQVGEINTWLADDVDVSGNYAYVADDWGDLVVVDVSDPSQPKQIGHLSTAGIGTRITVSGEYVYLSADGLYIVLNNVFTDVPADYWAVDYINRLYQSGITGGCKTDPLQYCPSASVTRAQMAVFLERGIHGADYQPPEVEHSRFGDVGDNFWAKNWIEALANDGITSGCGNGNFCPDEPVNRTQMAVFLLRAEHGADYTPPHVEHSQFNDIADDFWAKDWIDQLANEGITSGCGNGNYCPNGTVTRAQMAVFLVRAFGLP